MADRAATRTLPPPSPRMNDDLRWLIRLGHERGLFSAEQSRAVVAKLGGSPDLMAFAQELIDGGLVSAVDQLEELAGEAIAKSAKVKRKNGDTTVPDDDKKIDAAVRAFIKAVG